MPHGLPAAFAGGAKPRAGNHEHWNWQKFSCECSENFVASDREIFHPAADCIEDRVGDSGHSWHLARFADALRAIGPVSVVAFDENHFDLRGVTMRHDPVAVESGGQGLAISAIVDQIFV